MSIIGNALSFFHPSSKAEAEIPTNRQKLYRENPFEQLSSKIISHLQLYSRSNVILVFPSGQGEIIQRVLEVLRRYQDRIRVVISGEGIDISSGLAQRTACSVNADDVIVQIQKRTLESQSHKEYDSTLTELNDSIIIGCREPDNFLARPMKVHATRNIYQAMPYNSSFHVYEHRSSEFI